MGLSKFDKYLMSSLLVATIINVGSTYIGAINPILQATLGYVLAFTVIISTCYIAIKITYKNITSGKLAVEAFILDDKNRLLFYSHPYHRIFLPPGGRVKGNEFPDQALENRLKERIGLKKEHYQFDKKLHPTFDEDNNIGRVQRVPTPFIIQRELRKQRLFKSFHYDFIYVLNTAINIDQLSKTSKYEPLKFMNYDAVEKMVADRRTFPDVLDAYKRILAILNEE